MNNNLIAYELKPGIGITVVGDGVGQLDKTVSNVIGILTLVAFIFFVIQIILAGYAFISGQGDEKKIESARKRLTDGVLGITIVVVAFGLSSLIAKLLGLDNVFDIKTIITNMVGNG